MSEKKQLTENVENNNTRPKLKFRPCRILIDLIENEIVVYDDKDSLIRRIDMNKLMK